MVELVACPTLMLLNASASSTTLPSPSWPPSARRTHVREVTATRGLPEAVTALRISETAPGPRMTGLAFRVTLHETFPGHRRRCVADSQRRQSEAQESAGQGAVVRGALFVRAALFPGKFTATTPTGTRPPRPPIIGQSVRASLVLFAILSPPATLSVLLPGVAGKQNWAANLRMHAIGCRNPSAGG